MCFDVVFLFENMRTCLFTRVFMYFLHLVLTFTPHYIIMVKGLLTMHLNTVNETDLAYNASGISRKISVIMTLDSMRMSKNHYSSPSLFSSVVGRRRCCPEILPNSTALTTDSSHTHVELQLLVAAGNCSQSERFRYVRVGRSVCSFPLGYGLLVWVN